MTLGFDSPFSFLMFGKPANTEPPCDWHMRVNQESDDCAVLPFLRPPHSKMVNFLLYLASTVPEIDCDMLTHIFDSFKKLDPSDFESECSAVHAETFESSPWDFVAVPPLVMTSGLSMMARNLYRENIERDLAEQMLKSCAESGVDTASQLFYADILWLRGDMKNAIYYYERAAENGDDKAMYNLGCSLFYGEGQAQNIELAREYFRLGAQDGYCLAQHAYGTLIQDTDPYEAAIYLKLAADQGLPEAMCNYANLIDKHFGDNETAFAYWGKALDKGFELAMVSLGCGCYRRYIEALEQWQDELATVNMKGAVRFWRMAARAGTPYGHHQYGWALKVGFGVAKNYKKAIYHFKQAADQEIPESLVELADILHAQGEKREAQRLLEKAKEMDPTLKLVGEYRYLDYPMAGFRSLQTMDAL